MIAKIQDLDNLGSFLQLLRQLNKDTTIVHCHGCFDLLHIGHIHHFNSAKKLGTILVVTITPDHFVNKGPDRPMFPQRLRAEAVAALECVNYVAINKWPTATEAIERIKPNIFAKGAEYRTNLTRALAEEEHTVQSLGGSLVFTDDAKFSSSEIISKLKY